MCEKLQQQATKNLEPKNASTNQIVSGLPDGLFSNQKSQFG
jgi:hypothetical protein